MIKFDYSSHKMMWEFVKNNFQLAKKLGIDNIKRFARNSILKDDREIPFNCYACFYAKSLNVIKKKAFYCQCCPIKIGSCVTNDSLFERILDALIENDQKKYITLCDKMINASLKVGVEYE